MADDIVIRAEGLGKKYVIGHRAERERYVALRDVLARSAKQLRRKTNDIVRGHSQLTSETFEDFWALKDVNFEVRCGEVLGVVGRNGAGKSTLLKILSRITEPSEGRAILRGRVSSLLEVGTGFHPELTGRENVFLNGAILGMPRSDIKKKFDDIVAFAAVEKFVDTPVKRYSSGMYVRLAFAIAAHLEPDILVVDEVLAVGDAEFQKKCLGKMDEVSKSGKTILFVSHDLSKISTLCTSGILLDAGRVTKIGSISSVVEKYRSGQDSSISKINLSEMRDRTGSGEARVSAIELVGKVHGQSSYEVGEALSLRIEVNVHREIGKLLIATTINSSDGTPVFCFMNNDEASAWMVTEGQYEITMSLGNVYLYPGSYSLDVWLGDSNSHRLDLIREALTLTVVQGASLKIDRPLERANGLVYQKANWTYTRQ